MYADFMIILLFSLDVPLNDYGIIDNKRSLRNGVCV